MGGYTYSLDGFTCTCDETISRQVHSTFGTFGTAKIEQITDLMGKLTNCPVKTVQNSISSSTEARSNSKTVPAPAVSATTHLSAPVPKLSAASIPQIFLPDDLVCNNSGSASSVSGDNKRKLIFNLSDESCVHDSANESVEAGLDKIMTADALPTAKRRNRSSSTCSQGQREGATQEGEA